MDRQTEHTDRQTDRSYRTKRQTMVDKILHRNISTINTRVSSVAPEG